MKEWIRTDDNQWVYQISTNVFKLMEIRDFENRIMLVDTIIDLTDYTEEDLQSELSAYYDSLDQLKELYPDPNDQRQIAAECIFEQMWSELNVSYFDSEEDAYSYVEDYIKEYKG